MRTMRTLTVLALAAVSTWAAGGCKKSEPASAPAAKAGEAASTPIALLPPPAPVAEPAASPPTVPSAPWQKAPEGGEPAAAKADKLKIAKIAAVGEDPYGAFWKDVPYADIALLPQQMAMPLLADGTIPTLQVQAAHDGTTLAVRCAWKDETPDGNVDTGRFPDAVAIEFPLKPGAPPTMGSKDAPVQIIHWKAIWQKDIDVGYQDVQDIHPNFWSDLYWFTEGGYPYKVPDAFKKPESLQWLVAVAAGNPMAVLQRTTPAEELIATGWGTLTHQPTSASKARGLWAAGKWAVVFTRPLKTDDASDAQIEAGKPTQIAFAVWDGGKGQIGGRKHWATWQDVEVAP